MKSVQGVVAMLGYTRVSPRVVTYTVIEIGDQAVPDVAVPKRLIRYLVRSTRTQEASVLYLQDNRLIGIRVGDGQTYYYQSNRLLLAIFVLLSVLLIPALGLGVLMLWYGYRYVRYAKAANILAEQGATKVN